MITTRAAVNGHAIGKKKPRSGLVKHKSLLRSGRPLPENPATSTMWQHPALNALTHLCLFSYLCFLQRSTPQDGVRRRHTVRLLDAQTGEPVFKNDLWLTVWGKRRSEMSLNEIYEDFRDRFDLEFFFRFGKQKLFMDTFKTSDRQHN